MAKVYVRPAEYDYRTLRPLIHKIMDQLDGGRITRGSRVLIKPNLLAPASPARAMLTHPMIVRTVAEYVVDKGARPQISDSPATGFFDKVLRDSGIKDELKGLPVEFKEFRNSVVVEVGEPFQKLELAEDALRADVIVNLPKLKTHSQMLLTLGVKNLFGCVVGLRKPQWHLRAGVDRHRFAQLLVRIQQSLRPAVTILDGILAMEGQGPGRGGVPRHLGLLLASDNAVAVDCAVCRIFGLAPEALLTNKVAMEWGLVDGATEIDGSWPRIDDFNLPDITPVVFGPRSIHGFLRKYLVQRPVADASSCKLCGECWSYCPAQAISQEGRGIAFDYDKCIRCYCCLEVCPHGALRAEEPMPGKILGKLMPKGRPGGHDRY